MLLNFIEISFLNGRFSALTHPFQGQKSGFKSLASFADDYIIDVDRTTMRLPTGYPVETYL
jgi:hypothetical protein